MDYNYESLLDERFQMLCQSLLVQSYPDLQCFPVGMPDGGRDATSGAVIFQVKFARAALKPADAYKWIATVIRSEKTKVEELAKRGAKRYVLMTNGIAGSHLDSGTIDKIDSALAELPIPAQCWWRDDLDRRLDNNFDLKLRYPSLLSGQDAVRLLWSIACVGEGKERRQSALIAYMKHHYNQDNTIRFKQADIAPTPLFDIFIDVPILPIIKSAARARLVRSSLESAIEHAVITRMRAEAPDIGHIDVLIGELATRGETILVTAGDRGYTEHAVGAAELLINSKFAPQVLATVLEGPVVKENLRSLSS